MTDKKSTTKALADPKLQAELEKRRMKQRKGERVTYPIVAVNKGGWSDISEEDDKVGEFYIRSSKKNEESGKWEKEYLRIGKKFTGTVLAIRDSYSRWNNDLGRPDIVSNEFDQNDPNFPVALKFGQDMVSPVMRKKDLKNYLQKVYPNTEAEDRGYKSSTLKWRRTFYILANLPDQEDPKKSKLQVVRHMINYKSSTNWYDFDNNLQDIMEIYPVEFSTKKQKDRQVTYVTDFNHEMNGKDVVTNDDKNIQKIFTIQEKLIKRLNSITVQFFGMELEDVPVVSNIEETPEFKKLSALKAEDEHVETDEEEEVKIGEFDGSKEEKSEEKSEEPDDDEEEINIDDVNI
jgi:hypothetical protein